MHPFTLKGLYAITDNTLSPTTPLLMQHAKAALAGGAAILQYRNKSDKRAVLLEQAKALRALCNQYNKPLIINDDIKLAKAVSAHGVHLGQQDQTLQEARQVLGDNAIIGITCHDQLPLAIQAYQNGANYVAFGRFFNSKTKPGDIFCSTDLLTTAKQRINCPIVAIGGLTVENAPMIINHGADMIAVIHHLFGAKDINQQAQQLAQLFIKPSG